MRWNPKNIQTGSKFGELCGMLTNIMDQFSP